MRNQHIVDITIIWPDDRWNDTENEYLLDALSKVYEFLRKRPIENKEEHLTLPNMFGRIFAEIHVNPCREVSTDGQPRPKQGGT